MQREEFVQYCKEQFHRTRGEEWANGVTHLLGEIFGIVALVIMSCFAVKRGTVWHVTSCAIYGGTLIILFKSSALYHLFRSWKVKWVLQILDHATIYLLIAGTYTPYVLITLRDSRGWMIFGLVWGCALIGILLEIFCRRLASVLSLPLYLLMGWSILLDYRHVLERMETAGVATLVVGGIVYTLGVIFYLMDRVPYMHTIWHLFVLGGAVCHWVSICFFVIP